MTNPDQLAFYLLDIVTLQPINVGDILAPYFAQVYNRRQLTIDPDVLADALGALCKAGAIGHVEEGPYTQTFDVLPLTDVPASQLRSWIDSEELSPLYGLTSHGATMWAAYAHPRWEDYVQPDGDRNHLTITGANKDRVARFMDLYDRTWERVVDPIWTEIDTWQPFYWKTLTGHWYQVVAPAGSSDTPLDAEYSQREQELDYFMWGWYTHPSLG